MNSQQTQSQADLFQVEPVFFNQDRHDTEPCYLGVTHSVDFTPCCCVQQPNLNPIHCWPELVWWNFGIKVGLLALTQHPVQWHVQFRLLIGRQIFQTSSNSPLRRHCVYLYAFQRLISIISFQKFILNWTICFRFVSPYSPLIISGLDVWPT